MTQWKKRTTKTDTSLGVLNTNPNSRSLRCAEWSQKFKTLKTKDAKCTYSYATLLSRRPSILACGAAWQT